MTRLFGRARLYVRIASKSSLRPAMPAGFQEAGTCFSSNKFCPCTQLPANFNFFLKHLHTTMHKKKAAPKLKEAPLDSNDDIDVSKPADYNPAMYDPQESRSPPTEKILRIVDEIAHLTMIEAADLAHLLKRKLGLPDTAMPYYGGAVGSGGSTGAQGGPSPATQEEKKPEKTNFNVKLEKYDAASKIKIIKEVRTFTSLGLKEAKELVEKLPAVVKAGVAKEEAEKIVEKLKAVGGTCILE